MHTKSNVGNARLLNSGLIMAATPLSRDSWQREMLQNLDKQSTSFIFTTKTRFILFI